MKIRLKKTPSTGLIGVSILAFLVFSILVECDILVFLSLLLLIIVFAVCLEDISQHIFFLLYLVAFFTFLLGGQVVYEYFNYPMAYEYYDGEYADMNFKLLLSLIFIVTGYFIGKNGTQKTANNYITGKPDQILRKYSKYCFYVLLIPYTLTLLETISIVRASGYLEYYSYDSRLPAFITEAADLCSVSLCLFLATFPSKREAQIPIRIYFVLSVVTLLVGRRIVFVSQSLLLLGYMLIRNGDEVWLSRKEIVALVCLSPILIIGLYAYKYIRYGRDIKADTIAEAFLGFFQQQGFSANLIMLGKRYASELTDHIYSFYCIIRFIKINPISRYILRLSYIKDYTGSRENLALHSGSFAQIISYLSMRARYLLGFGTGSCYIAELYHDFGYIGIMIGNLVYGLTLKKISNLGGSVLKTTIYLMMFRHFLMAPRYSFDHPYFVVFSISFWMFIGFMYFLLHIELSRHLTE